MKNISSKEYPLSKRSVSKSGWLSILAFALLLLVLEGCRSGTHQSPLSSESGENPSSQSPITLTPNPASSQPVITATLNTPASPMLPFSPFGIEIADVNDIEPVFQSGAQLVRINALLWSQVESQEGVRDWSAVTSLEDELKIASEQGLRVILIVRGTPTWAQKVSGSYCGPITPEKLSAFTNFMAEAVTRYSPPPYNVGYWELGNEPDVDPALVPPDMVFGCWGEPADPYYGGEYYSEMLKSVYPQIKTSNPAAQVLIGGLLLNCDPLNPPETQAGSGSFSDCTSSKFLEGILKNDGGDYFDGVSFHAYDYYYETYGHYGNTNWDASWKTSGPVVVAKINYLHNLLDDYGYQEKYLMNTEVALLCGKTGSEQFCNEADFTNTKAIYLVQSYATALAEGLSANIWYSLRGWRGSGLVNKKYQPNIAYQAFQFSAAHLDGAAFEREISEYPSLKGYAFNHDGVQTWLLWALDDRVHSISLPDRPDAVFDMAGEPLSPDQQISITLAPVYIDWNP